MITILAFFLLLSVYIKYMQQQQQKNIEFQKKIQRETDFSSSFHFISFLIRIHHWNFFSFILYFFSQQQIFSFRNFFLFIHQINEHLIDSMMMMMTMCALRLYVQRFFFGTLRKRENCRQFWFHIDNRCVCVLWCLDLCRMMILKKRRDNQWWW